MCMIWLIRVNLLHITCNIQSVEDAILGITNIDIQIYISSYMWALNKTVLFFNA